MPSNCTSIQFHPNNAHPSRQLCEADKSAPQAVPDLLEDPISLGSDPNLLQENQQLYHALVSLTGEGIWRVDFDHPISLALPEDDQIEAILSCAYIGNCSRAFAEMNGFPNVEALRGQRLTDLLDCNHPDTRDFIRMILRSSYHVINLEACEPDGHGSARWFTNNVFGVIVDHQLVAALGTQRDITRRKRNENIQTALYQIAQATSSTPNLQDFFRSIHAILGELMPARNLYIALYDAKSDTISFPYFADEHDSTPKPHKANYGGMTEYVLHTGKPLWTGPHGFDALSEKEAVFTVGTKPVDWLGVPLITQNRIIGVLVVQTYSEGTYYTEVEKDILVFVSNQVAMAIERKRAEETLRINEARYRAIVEDQTELISRFLPDGTLTFVNQAYSRYFGLPREKLIGIRFYNLIPIQEHIDVENKLRTLTPDHPVVTIEAQGYHSQYEVCWLQWLNRAIYDENDELIEYQSVGRDITDRKRAEDELRYLSTHDQLTGIYNRTYFEEVISHHRQENEFPVSLLMADMDGLKAINDSQGHPQGDELLRQTASLLRSVFRANDVVARIGGDEFGIILSNADCMVARKLVDRIRKHLRQHNADHPELPIHISIGYATAVDSAELSEAYRQADEMMYQEKHRHHNQRQAVES